VQWSTDTPKNKNNSNINNKMDIVNTNIIKEVLYYQKSLIENQIDELDSIFYGFSPIIGLSGYIPKDIRGVYKLIYLPDDRIMYIGEGNIKQRIVQHKRIFNNSGNKKIYTSKKGGVQTQVDSAAGRRMWEYDDNLSNWGVSYLKLDLPSLKEVEDTLILKYNPEFNRIIRDKKKVVVNNPFW
jgi:hypothetical protein